MAVAGLLHYLCSDHLENMNGIELSCDLPNTGFVGYFTVGNGRLWPSRSDRDWYCNISNKSYQFVETVMMQM